MLVSVCVYLPFYLPFSSSSVSCFHHLHYSLCFALLCTLCCTFVTGHPLTLIKKMNWTELCSTKYLWMLQECLSYTRDHYVAKCMCYLYFNTLGPRQNGHRFADDTFKRIFLNENVRIAIEILLKFDPKGPINNNPALVRIKITAWPAPSHYLKQWRLFYRRIYASLGLNELIIIFVFRFWAPVYLKNIW